MTSLEQLKEQIQNAQKKIIELEKKEAEEKAEFEKKQTTIEPNMKVFSEWLDTSKEIEKKNNIKIKYDELMLKRHQNYVEECNKYSGRHPPGYSYEPINKKIRDEYNKYWGTDASGKPTYLKDIETFEPKFEQFNNRRNKGIKVPSEFMIHFIEATHNMFLIQQKRIDELETKVELLTGNKVNIISKNDDEDDSYEYGV